MRIKELRINNKLTQEDIAKLINITASSYGYYEAQKTEPNINTLCVLADFYHVSLDYLIGRDYINKIGYLTSRQRQAVDILKNLNKDNLIKTIGYMHGLLEIQTHKTN